MAKQTWVNVGGTWRKVKSAWVNVNGVWKKDVMPKGVVSGNWKEFMSYLSIYYLQTSQKLYSLSSSGNEGWEYEGAFKSFTVNPDNGYIYARTSAGDNIVKLSSQGDLVWSKKYPYSLEGQICVNLRDEIFAIIKDGAGYNILKIDSNGNEKWSSSGATYYGGFRWILADKDGNVFVDSESGDYYQFRKRNGTTGREIYWKTTTDEQPRGLAVNKDGDIYIPYWSNRIRRYKNRDGGIISGFIIDDGAVSISIDYENSIYIVPYTSSYIEKYDMTGNILWRMRSYGTPQRVEVSSDNTFYVSSHKRVDGEDKSFISKYTFDRKLLWEFELPFFTYTLDLVSSSGKVGAFPHKWK